MADDLISSLYPPPPPYYKFFSEENILRFEEWKENNEELALPPGELRLQVPPEVPRANQYRGYGSLWALENSIPSLKDLGWKQLYSDEDELITSQAKIDELHKLLDSLLLNFLELVGGVSVEPSKFYLKIEDLKLILINMNHLLNTYRPHQTRESLIMLLKKQIESKRAEINDIGRVTGEVKEKILKLVQSENITNLVDQHVAIPEQNGTQESERELKLAKLRRLLAASKD